MTNTASPILLGVALALATSVAASAQTAPKAVDGAVVEKYLASTFSKAPPEWQERIKPDETLAVCNKYRNHVPAAEAEKITAREMAKVKFPADGQFLGDWKSGAKIANEGRGNQFSDPPGTVAGGNCYSCHQMEAAELSYGTLGPSLTGYGKTWKNDPEAIKRAYAKIYDSQSQVACSNMPRFGTNNVLSEAQMKDIMAFLFDPASPVNK